jgi:hypothetical protein
MQAEHLEFAREVPWHLSAAVTTVTASRLGKKPLAAGRVRMKAVRERRRPRKSNSLSFKETIP